MDAAKQHLASLSHGTILRIKNLESARGRQGRVWKLMPGQFLMTFVLKPKLSNLQAAQQLQYLFMAITLGVLEPLKIYGAGLKWPNDIIIQGKKVGGILMESVWQEEQLQGLVVGFAVNVNNRFEDDDPLQKTATSVCSVMHQEFDIALLEQAFLQALNSFYTQWSDGKFQSLFEFWKNAQVFMGQKVFVHHRDGSVVSGIMQGVTPQGDLILKDHLNNVITVVYAQVLEVLT